jgi:YebC/PmpR family DNA-binding regulatory protein
MSGHSHWSGIKHKKGIQDAKRAKIFTKLAKPIVIAAREGGGNPDTNFKLKIAIDQARSFNMPKDNIERAVKRGTGEIKGADITEVVYEAFGPGGIMMIIKTLTDNTNRTVSEIKTILSKVGGKFGGPGSVMWNFERSQQEYMPKNKFVADENVKNKYEKLLEALDDQDDVEEIYDNL